MKPEIPNAPSPPGGGHPGNKSATKGPGLRLVAWEATRNCNLTCIHCRASATNGPYEGELDTQAGLKLMDEIARVGKPIVILTGGDPMLRPDIFEIAKYGTSLGLRMVMSPNGTLITPENAAQMVESGIKRISVSLDGATAERHDKFRGVPGAFDGALRGIEYGQSGRDRLSDQYHHLPGQFG